MAIYEFDSEEEFDYAFDKIEDINQEHRQLKEDVQDAYNYYEECQCELEDAQFSVKEASKSLDEAEEALEKFEEENSEFIIRV